MRLSLEQRFKIGASIFIFLLIFLGFWANYQFQVLNEEIANILNSVLAGLKFSKESAKLLDKFRSHQIATLLSHEAASFSELLNDLCEIRNHIQNANNELPNLILNANEILVEIGSYTQEIEQFFTVPLQERLLRYVHISLSHQRLLNFLVSALNRNQEIFASYQNRIINYNKFAQMRMVMVWAITIGIVIFFTIFFSKQVVLPVRRIKNLIETISEGNYHITTRETANDELGQIFSLLAKMAERIAIRDNLKIQKISIERSRFAALANDLNESILLINAENKIAFANNHFFEFTKLTWDEVFEVDLNKLSIPVKLREKLEDMISKKEWGKKEIFSVNGDKQKTILFSTIPVKNENGEIISTIVKLKES